MNSNAVSAPPAPRPRRIWRWLLAGTVICLGAAGLAAYNLVTLTRDASTLRNELISVLGRTARTQVQVTVGPFLLTTVRTVASAFDRIPQEARLGLRAVRNASVGVYKLRGKTEFTERTRMLAAADEVMQGRGWTRVVGVSEDENLVLVYVPEAQPSGSTEKVCVAVCSDEYLVVVSGSVRMDHLVEFATHHRLIAGR